MAFDLGGNPSVQSEPLGVIIENDILKPLVPSNLKAENILIDAVTIKWEVPTDNVGVIGYEIYRDGAKVGTTTEASYVDTAVEENKSYKYSVTAFDEAGNISDKSAELIVTIIKGIEAYYKLDDGSGNIAYDFSGKNNNGTIYGTPTWKTNEGILGGALEFDGVDDAVQLVQDGASGFMHDAFDKRTISISFKANTTNGTRSLFDQGGNSTGIAMHIKNGKLEAAVRNKNSAGTVVQTTVSTPFTDTNSWHKALVVFNSGTLKLYLDGELVDSKTAPYTTVAAHVNQGGFGARFGYDALGGPTGIGDYFAGMIDEVRIYTDDITESSEGIGDYTVSKPIITDSTGNNVEALNNLTSLNVSVTITNGTDLASPATLIAVLYDENNSIKDMKFIEGTANPGRTTISLSEDKSLDLIGCKEGNYVKVFVWDNIQNMKPLTNYTQISYNK